MGRWLFAASMLAVGLVVMGGNAHAQSRKPTAQEVAAIRGCSTKYQDDLDAGEENCLFKLVANPCAGPPGTKDGAAVADCYDIESADLGRSPQRQLPDAAGRARRRSDGKGQNHAARLDKLSRHHLRLL